ncbi:MULTISPECIES: DUF6933 domain-containing protein [Bacillus]|uniref:DUF6933 domain-containing protein n=1 Tax=Bacillus pseudomycoides TaxID=64104 RepID=A0AAJ1Z415_9BACI|nr:MULTISPECIES: hypothetical protein [Bacillus]EEM11090.1 hypothetical protein bmyco0003_21790 [Bacillus pseudomycoides]KFN15186.1 hypothetical protein DJ94_1023 [Bacillus pseudomycoides]MDR4188268.1 hypothetical protein [Bacillus pseudomycoides]MDR4328411.1 hypothetical protein [Bacillus pseudomycoides]MED0857977.1 hypothetical protein [Bacillus pseudomycoides]
MQLIQCTKKLADAMEIKTEKIDLSDSNTLNCWHANLFTINRKKCVIVMNNITRYHFMIYGVTKKDLRNLEMLFKKDLVTNLLLDGIEPEVIEQYLNQDPTIQYAATNNRSIISQMNESVFMINDYFYNELVVKKSDFINMAELNHCLNRTIMLKLPKYPVEMMRDVLMQQFPTD